MGYSVPGIWGAEDRDMKTGVHGAQAYSRAPWRKSLWVPMSRSWSCLHTFFSCIFVFNYSFIFLWFFSFLPLNSLFFIFLKLVIVDFCHLQLDESEGHTEAQIRFLLSFFFFIIFYLFIFGCVGSSFLCEGTWGPLFIGVRGPLTTVASLVVEHRL